MELTQHPIVVFGQTGQIGKALGRLLGNKAYYVARSEADFTNPASFTPLIERLQPSAIVNAVAYTQVDKAEEEEGIATLVNADAPEALARLAKHHAIPLVHYSTDYVFDGKSAPYDVDAQPNPLNKYGQMKYEGEKRVLASNPGLCHLWCYIRELTSTT